MSRSGTPASAKFASGRQPRYSREMKYPSLLKLGVVGTALSSLLFFQNCTPNSGLSGAIHPSLASLIEQEDFSGALPLPTEVEKEPAEPTPPTDAIVPSPTPTPSDPPKLKIAMFGDSTMWGVTVINGVTAQSPTNAPATFQLLLDKEFGRGVVAVENHGVGGSFCSQWLNGVISDGVKINKTWQQQVASTDAKILVMNVGINDAYQPDSIQSQTAFQQCYYQLAKVAQDAGKIFVFQTPNPIFSAHSALVKQRRDDIVLIQSIFSGFPIIDIHSVQIDWRSHLPDSIHPDDEGYRIVGWHHFHVLSPLIATMVK